MIKPFIALSAAALISACATNDTQRADIDEAAFTQAVIVADAPPPRETQIVETPRPLPLPGQLKRIDASLTGAPVTKVAPQDAIRHGASQARIEPSVDGYVNAIQVYPYTEGALYRLYCSPGQVSDIALQPGEELVSVSAGDTVRWVVGDTVSGAGANSRAHVLVKPISAAINTNLMIATNRRTYHLELESSAGGYMAALSWRYPQDEMAKLTARNQQAAAQTEATVSPQLALSDLNFDYRLSGDSPDWTPVRVFDDGRQVFIQMPQNLAATDAPPLFILGTSGDAELVNYRVRANYYIVDRLFQAAELRIGAKNQTVVRITKNQPRKGLAALFGG